MARDAWHRLERPERGGRFSTGRLVVIDGEAQKSAGALGEHMRMLWLTPAMDRLFAGPASDRRRFLDRMVTAFDPEHGARILVFEKVMRERNLLLEETRPDAAWLSSLEAHMAEAAVAIAAARLVGLEALQTHITVARDDESSFPWSEISVEGEIEAHRIATTPAVRVEDEYRKILRDSRGLDRAAGRTLRGPHRSDLAVVHGPRAMAAGQCSTGEQKALLIGLILAQARAVKSGVGVAPVLLLDEVAAHLDRARRLSLLKAWRALGSQSWMTGTDAELFDGMGDEGTVFHVEDGTVRQVVER
jgi:DNA replication and repair protein RecF